MNTYYYQNKYGANFGKIIVVVLRHEGGYVNHPNDPGGETNYGISKRAFPNVDIKNLTEAQAVDIYYNNYWRPMNLTAFNPNLSLHVFDHGINAGKRVAVRMLQRIVDTTPDGIIGPMTLRAVNEWPFSYLIDQYKTARRQYYCDLVSRRHQMVVFLRGWQNRVNNTTL